MIYDIKHITLSLLSLACIASCSSEPDAGSVVSQSQEEMRFEVVGGTRVVATTNENIKNRPFMLFGDVKLSAASPDTIFGWHSVEYKNNVWDYGVAKQYWYMGREHSFVAIHPFIEKGNPQVTILTYVNNKLEFTYTLPDTLQNACDLLFATHRRKYSLDNKGPVNFQFTHLLARINIMMGFSEKDLMYDYVDEKVEPFNKNEFIQVHSVEFKEIRTKAQFKFFPKQLGSGSDSNYDYDYEYVIGETDTLVSKTVELQNPNKVPNSYDEDDPDKEIMYVKALTDEEVIVMLPQEFGPESTSQMIVNYSINEDVDTLRQIVIPLKNTTWKVGTSYTYKFKIDNVYYNHIVKDGEIQVDIEDFRLAGKEGDDSWITDPDDPYHYIRYGYESGKGGVNGPID